MPHRIEEVQKSTIYKEWNSKKLDLVFLLLYFGALVFIFIEISLFIDSTSAYDSIFSRLFSSTAFFYIFPLMFIALLIYWGKTPKTIILDEEKNRLFVLHRYSDKSKQYDLKRITYFFQKTFFYSVLEINADFVNSRGKELDIRIFRITVFHYGMFWNKRILEEIEFNFKTLDIPIKKVFGLNTFWEYLFDNRS